MCVIRLQRKKAAEERGSGRGEIKRDSYKSALNKPLISVFETLSIAQASHSLAELDNEMVNRPLRQALETHLLNFYKTCRTRTTGSSRV